MLVFILLVWFVAPIVLLILFIVKAVEARHLKDEVKRLLNENYAMKNEKYGARFPERPASVSPPPSPTTPPEVCDSEAPASAVPENAAAVSAETVAVSSPVHIAEEAHDNSVKNVYDMPYSNNYQPSVPAKPAPAPKKEKVPAAPAQSKEKHGVSTINIMLIIGALLIITSGLIFATSAWDVMSNGFRAIVIFSFSAIFFAASSLAERKLHLIKTGTLFYTLGSVFLPITLIAAGYFEVFGSWFSLSGEGCPLLLCVTFAALAAVSLKGSTDYKSKAFAWCSLISVSAAVTSAAAQISASTDIISLVLAIYSFAAVLVCRILSKSDSERFSVIVSLLSAYAALNAALMSFSALICCFDSGRSNVISLISCTVFASTFLHNMFTEKNGFGGALPFTLFISAGLFSLTSPDSVNGFTYIFIGVSVILSVFSLMNIIPQKLGKAFALLSVIIQTGTLAVCICCTVFSPEITWVSFAAYAVLTGDILLLAKLHGDTSEGKLLMSLFPAACAALGCLLSRLLLGEATVKAPVCLCAVILLALQLTFVFLPKLKLRTVASDLIFSLSSATAAVVMLVMYAMKTADGGSVMATALCTVLSLLVMTIKNNEASSRGAYCASACVTSGMFCIPIFELIKNSVGMTTYIAVNIASGAWLAVLAAVSVVSTVLLYKKGGEVRRKIDYAIIASMRALTCIYVIIAGAVSPADEYSNGFMLGLALLVPVLTLLVTSAVRSVLLKSKAEQITMLISIMALVHCAALLIFGEMEYAWILVFVCGAAAAIYAVNEFMQPSENKTHFYELTCTVSRWSLALLSAFMIPVYLDSYSGKEYLIAIAAVFALSMFVNYKARATLSLIPQLIMLYVLLTDYADIPESENLIGVMFIAVYVISVVLSYVLHFNSVCEKKENGKPLYIDGFALTRFFGVPVMYSALSLSYEWSWAVLLVLAASFASLYRKNGKPLTNRIMLTACSALLAVSWIEQPFFTVPDIISAEYSIVAVLLFFFSLKFIFKENGMVTDMLTYIAYCISYTVLFCAAFESAEIADGMIIVISALLMLVYSFLIKRKKWFVLSVVVIVASTVLLSISFWGSALWWVYLIVAGLILIGIGALNEVKKQSVKSEFSEKVSRFMSEWTW